MIGLLAKKYLKAKGLKLVNKAKSKAKSRLKRAMKRHKKWINGIWLMLF